MNRQTLLTIYDRLEALISKLPGPLQNAVIGGIETDQADFSVPEARQNCFGGQTRVPMRLLCFPVWLAVTCR